MVDPWIPMRYRLAEDLELMSLGTWLGTVLGTVPGTGTGTSLGMSRKMLRRAAVGMLLETWGLFHREADETGLLRGVHGVDLDELVGVPTWADALLGVGWIELTPDGVRACDFEKYIGSRRKNQARAREKKRAQRAAAKERDEDAQPVPGDRVGDRAGTVPGTVVASCFSLSSESGSVQGEVQEGGPRAKPSPLARALAKCLPPPDPRVVAAAHEWDEHTRDKTAQAQGGPNLVLSERAWLVQLTKAARDPAAWVAHVAENLGANSGRLQDAPKRSTHGAGNGPRKSSQDAFRSNLVELEQTLAAAFPDPEPTQRAPLLAHGAFAPKLDPEAIPTPGRSTAQARRLAQ